MLDFIGQKQAYAFNGLFSPVNVVSQEEVVSITRESSVLEQLEEIRELSVDIAADLDGGLEFQEHGLRQEDLPRFQA